MLTHLHSIISILQTQIFVIIKIQSLQTVTFLLFLSVMTWRDISTTAPSKITPWPLKSKNGEYRCESQRVIVIFKAMMYTFLTAIVKVISLLIKQWGKNITNDWRILTSVEANATWFPTDNLNFYYFYVIHIRNPVVVH